MKLVSSGLLEYRFVRYGFVGVISVIIDYGLLYYSYSISDLGTNLSISIGFWGSTIFNFLMHRFYTFSNTRGSNHLNTFIKYLLLVFSSFFATLALIELTVDYTYNIYFAKFITLLIVYIYGFFISRYFVFV